LKRRRKRERIKLTPRQPTDEIDFFNSRWLTRNLLLGTPKFILVLRLKQAQEVSTLDLQKLYTKTNAK
jgi:hypothetical protein